MPPFSVLVITFVAVLGHAALWAGRPVGSWVLPVAAGLALSLRRPQLPRFDGWLPVAVAVAGFVAITYGCVATMDRSWDGFATWSLTARHFAAGANLDHPYFANASVYHAVRGYPLLQPILLQQASLWLGEQAGRALFPVLWLLLLMAVREPLAALGVLPRLRMFAVTGMALVPLFTEPGHGSAESGFAELLLALLLTHAAAAIVLRQPWLALCVGLCLPVVKHEGLVHLLPLVAVATFAGAHRTGLALAGGGGLALLGWVPLQLRLGLHESVPGAVVGLASLPIAVCLWSQLIRARRTRLVALLLALAGLGLAVSNASRLPIALAQVVSTFTELPTWAQLGKITGSLGQQLVWVRKVGFSFVCVVVAAVLAARRRRQPGSQWQQAAPLLGYLLAWFLMVFLFLLSLDTEQLPLFLKEGTGRYLGQVLGVVWLVSGLLLRECARPGIQAPSTAIHAQANR